MDGGLSLESSGSDYVGESGFSVGVNLDVM